MPEFKLVGAKALDTLTPRADALLRAFALVPGARWCVPDTNFEAPCPVSANHKHGDEHPSFGMWLDDESRLAWNCSVCVDRGALRTALKRLGVSSADLGAARSSAGRGTAADLYSRKPETPPRQPDPLHDQERPHDHHSVLMSRGHVLELKRLMTRRGWTDATLQRRQIGWDGQRYTFPVRLSGGGPWLNLRRYSMSEKPKMLNIPGHGTVTLYGAEFTEGNTLPVLLTEGEPDQVLAQQMADEEPDRRFVAVSHTGGAKTIPKDLSPLAGRQVYVCFDTDEPGRLGAEKMRAALRAVGARAFVLDLTALGMPSDDKTDNDFTDWVLKHGGTVDRLMGEMERLGSDLGAAQDAGEDAVLAAVKAAFLVSDDPLPEHYDEGLSDDQVAALPPLRYVVDGWLQRGFYTSFYGAPGTMKTFVANDLARCVRAGLPWHDNPVERGAVLMYAGEGLTQLRDRNAAWDAWYSDGDPLDLAAGLSFQRFVDLSRPEGVASVIRTVRRFEFEAEEPVALIVIDPAVEFFTGEENGEGMEQFTRGVRALAQYLDVAVLVVHHSNASGERARGTDHMRMRSGGHVRVERVKDAADRIAVVVEKQKNAEHRALVLDAVPSKASLALRTHRSTTAMDYLADTAEKSRTAVAEKKLQGSSEAHTLKTAKAKDLLLKKVAESPGLSQTKLKAAVTGHGVGADTILAVLADLIESGQVDARPTHDGDNAPILHYPVDAS